MGRSGQTPPSDGVRMNRRIEPRGLCDGNSRDSDWSPSVLTLPTSGFNVHQSVAAGGPMGPERGKSLGVV